MKAREIKKSLWRDYNDAIEEYNLARVRLEAKHNEIRRIEIDLKRYFNIDVTHNFE